MFAIRNLFSSSLKPVISPQSSLTTSSLARTRQLMTMHEDPLGSLDHYEKMRLVGHLIEDAQMTRDYTQKIQSVYDKYQMSDLSYKGFEELSGHHNSRAWTIPTLLKYSLPYVTDANQRASIEKRLSESPLY